MTQEGFKEYLLEHYSNTSGATSSYLRAIEIIKIKFSTNDVFGLNGTSLCCIENLELLIRILEFVKNEEKKFHDYESGFFALGDPTPPSYPKGGFCSAAMKSLIGYYESCQHESAQKFIQSPHSGVSISQKLTKHYRLNDSSGNDVLRETRVRIGQDFFRRMLLDNYNGKCCVTGLNVPQVLRASHIVAWADDKKNRMNPENGLLLSATYDAAFDNHLISFDDDYRMIVSKDIKEYYTNDVTKEYFMNFEGKQIILPTQYLPSKELLEKHRNRLVC